MDQLTSIVGRLLCVECLTVSDERARGWRAYLGGGFDDDEVEVGTYCPDCAAYEFGDAA